MIVTYLKSLDEKLHHNTLFNKVLFAAIVAILMLRQIYPEPMSAILLWAAPILIIGSFGMMAVFLVLLLILLAIAKINGRPLKRRSRTQE